MPSVNGQQPDRGCDSSGGASGDDGDGGGGGCASAYAGPDATPRPQSHELTRAGSGRRVDGPDSPIGTKSAAAGMEVVRSSLVWLETVGGDVHEVERDVALLLPLVQREVTHSGHGASEDAAIVLPKQVTSGVLRLILEFCRFHKVPGRSDKERKLFDEKFIRLDTRKLCELTSAADSLDMKPLVDLTSRALARMIEGKTPEEIRETFHLPDDLTEEEKLEPVKNATDDPRIRLLNRLYARKRKELQQKKLLKTSLMELEDKPCDERSVDDLLSFIDGNRADEKTTGSRAKKKKNRRRKELRGDIPLQASVEEMATLSQGGALKESMRQEIEAHVQGEDGQKPQRTKAAKALKSKGVTRVSKGKTFKEAASSRGDLIFDEEDFDDDDGLDPLEKERLDREIEDFARRLNSDWPDRMQEILALASSSMVSDEESLANSPSEQPELQVVDQAGHYEQLGMAAERLKELGNSSDVDLALQLTSTGSTWSQEGEPLRFQGRAAQAAIDQALPMGKFQELMEEAAMSPRRALYTLPAEDEDREAHGEVVATKPGVAELEWKLGDAALLAPGGGVLEDTAAPEAATSSTGGISEAAEAAEAAPPSTPPPALLESHGCDASAELQRSPASGVLLSDAAQVASALRRFVRLVGLDDQIEIRLNRASSQAAIDERNTSSDWSAGTKSLGLVGLEEHRYRLPPQPGLRPTPHRLPHTAASEAVPYEQ
eukprot:SM000038S14333  [mRNA]  locus=s38:359686:363999:+ [translate_table: standard]